MSQIYKSVSSTPSVATTYVEDSGNAVPVANILNILGNDSTTNNANGITTTGAGNTVTVLLTNRLQGTGSTVGAVTADIITFSLGVTPGNYSFEVNSSAFNSTTPAGQSFSIFGSARTTGVAATVIGTPDETFVEDAAFAASDIDLIASGNNIIVRVTGVAGLTINWSIVVRYVFVG